MEPFKHLKLYFDVEPLLFLTYYNFFYNVINLNILIVFIKNINDECCPII
jgi:hypothetical protein